MKIRKEEIQRILDDKINLKYWILQLGYGYVYESLPIPPPPEPLPYMEYGKKLWKIMESEIHDLICDKDNPKDWVKELIEGDIRNLIIGIISAITAKFEIGLGIAIPIAALVIKKGIKDFCKLDFKKKEKHIDVTAIIKNKQIELSITEMAKAGYISKDDAKKLLKTKVKKTRGK